MVTESIIGYELNETYCQISFYDREQGEPVTAENGNDNYQIPLMVGKKKETWVIGNEARHLTVTKEGWAAENLYQKAVRQEKIVCGEETYEAVYLLAKFVEVSLKKEEHISEIVFTVPTLSIDIVKMLKSVGQRARIPKENITVQDYKESFCYYMLYQPKELWQYEAALFHCDRHEVKAFMLRKMKDAFITVDEVAQAQMEELSQVYPVLNVDRAKDADTSFCRFIQGVFSKKLVSSVFLVGEGFENNWYPQSLKVLCNGRRAFLGNNLYSKGACYTAYRRHLSISDAPIYLDETKMMDQICLRLRVHGMDQWTPVVTWGSRWYEADAQFEILLENAQDIEVHVESLVGKMQAFVIPMTGLPKRENYTLRLQVKLLFTDEKTCKMTFTDLGFGEFFPATAFTVEKEIHLGGSNGQYHSLS